VSLAFSQEPVSIHLTQKDGLPDIEFYDILEDRKGFIWLAADKGLYRYNGKEYTNYSHIKKRGLSVFNLIEDKKGRLWCNNISGQFFYVENDSLHLFFDIKDKIKTTKLPVFSVDDESNINISTDKGLYHVNFTSKKLTEIVKIKEKLSPIPPNITAYNTSLFFFHDSISQFKERKFHQSFTFKSTNTYNRIFPFNKKLYLISSTAKHFTANENNTTDFYHIDIETGTLIKQKTPKELINKTILSVVEINTRIWFNTNNGAFVYTVKEGEFVLEKKFFEGDYITRVLKDKNENYWLSTLKNGIYIIPNLSITKLTIPKPITNISSLAVIKDHLICGTDKGCLVLNNLNTGKTRTIELGDEVRILKLAFNTITNSLFICGDGESFLWDLNTGKAFRSLDIKGAKDMSTVNKNAVLISNHDGAYTLDFSNYKSTQIKKKERAYFKLSSQYVTAKKRINVSSVRSYAHHYKGDSTIYIGQIDKLFFYNKQGQKKEIKFNENSIFATDITETRDKTVWVSTNESGILGIQNREVVYQYNTTNGLFTNQALKVLADDNNLWVVTNKGLHFFDRDNISFKSFSFKNEIPIQKVTDIQLYKDKLFLSGNNGVFVVDKAYLKNRDKAPKVYFESVHVGNIEKEIQEKYIVAHHENSFEVTFNTNFYNSKEVITYLYRLREIESDWKLTTTGIVRYPSLPSGPYTFEVKSLTNKGVESAEVESIQLTITTPFWNQWWFYVLIILIGFTYVKVLIKRIREKQEKELENEKINKELVLSQLENLRSQMNPHFIFNVLNSIQEYIVTNDKYTASIYLVEFSKLIRMYLDHSQKEEVFLYEEVKALKIYLALEKNRFDKDFKYTITLPEEIATKNILVPSLFIQPYIENAIKHGLLHRDHHKELIVSFEYDDPASILKCYILDNGIGREVSKKINEENKKYHTSFATQANRDRVALLNKNRKRKIVVQVIDMLSSTQKPVGTKVIISIPQKL
jgi:ligand-binding sensor domain-containing protein